MDRILLGILRILSKSMNFRVAKVYGNNGMFYRDTKSIEPVFTKHFHNRGTVTFTGN